MSGVPSDHDAVETHRTAIEHVGRTGRVRVPLPLPGSVGPEAGECVRLSLDGRAHHAQVRTSLKGDREFRGAFENARLARTRDEGENHLQAWAEAGGLGAGDTVLVDVVTAGFHYGVRRPGERAVYEPIDPPSRSLTDIARDLEG